MVEKMPEELDEQLDDLKQQIEKATLAQDQAGLFEALYELAEAYLNTGRWANALQNLEKALHLVKEGYTPPPPKLRRLYLYLGRLTHRMGELKKASEYYREGLAVAGGGPEAISLQAGLAAVLLEMDQVKEALVQGISALEAAGEKLLLKKVGEFLLGWVEICEELHGHQHRAGLTTHLLLSLAQAGAAGYINPRIGRELLAEVMQVCVDSGDERGLAQCAEIRAEFLLNEGRVAEAREELKQALEIYQFLRLRRESNRVYLRWKQLEEVAVPE